MEKANSYPWIPGGGMAIEVSVDGKVRREEGCSGCGNGKGIVVMVVMEGVSDVVVIEGVS